MLLGGCIGDAEPGKDYCFPVSSTPTSHPTESEPSKSPTLKPLTHAPTASPMDELTSPPSNASSESTTNQIPTWVPTHQPSIIPSSQLSSNPSTTPSHSPLSRPTQLPSSQPTTISSLRHSSKTSNQPSVYNSIQLATATLQRVFTGDGVPPNPLPECHGDCDDDSQCVGDLVCFQRYVILKNHD